MITHEDLQLIASAVKDADVEYQPYCTSPFTAKMSVVCSLANKLQGTCSEFDRAEFIQSCTNGYYDEC